MNNPPSTQYSLQWAGDEFDLAPPPGYNFPSRFRVGMWTTEALVNTSNVKGHLMLLQAFASLRLTVDGLEPNSMAVWLDQMPEDKDKRWTWFVGRAVERFDRWVNALQHVDGDKRLEDVLPPLDVIMVAIIFSIVISIFKKFQVWHSYMLNPGYVLPKYSQPDIDCIQMVRGGLSTQITSPDIEDHWQETF